MTEETLETDPIPTEETIKADESKFVPRFLQKYLALNKWLKEEVEFRKDELREMLKTRAERDEEFLMIKKLARKQVEELKEHLDRANKFEQLYEETKAELDLKKEGVKKNGKEVKALALVPSGGKKGKSLFAPVVFTLSEDGKTILDRNATAPDCEKKFAIDNAKIAFMNLFDPTATQ